MLFYEECPTRYACCFHWKNIEKIEHRFLREIYRAGFWPTDRLSSSREADLRTTLKLAKKRPGYLAALLEIVKLLFQIFIPKMCSFLEIIEFFKRISRICTSYILWVKSIEFIVELSLVSYVFEQFSVIRLKLARKFRRFFRTCSWRVQLRFSSSRFCSTISL